MAQQMTEDEIREACSILEYYPYGNITGLRNGSARILYDGWTCPPSARPGGSVFVHSLIPEPRYLTKGFLREMFRYAFEHADWAIGVTPAFNTKALKFNQRLGFDQSFIIPGGYAPGIALLWQTMHHTQCRYYQRSGSLYRDAAKENV